MTFPALLYISLSFYGATEMCFRRWKASLTPATVVLVLVVVLVVTVFEKCLRLC